jgi:hypothetical protein
VDAHAAPAAHADPLSSGDRFATIARAVEGGRARDIDDAFRVLDAVRVPSRTKWQIVWSIGKRAVSFRDREGARAANVSMDVASVRCEGAPRVRAIGRAGDDTGFVRWSNKTAAQAQEAVLVQVGTRAGAAPRLAAAVAAATRASSCVATE